MYYQSFVHISKFSMLVPSHSDRYHDYAYLRDTNGRWVKLYANSHLA